jgi:hypothetical protein
LLCGGAADCYRDKSAECIEQFLDIIQSFIKVVNLKMIVALPVGCIIMNKVAANGMHADNTRAPTRWAIFPAKA